MSSTRRGARRVRVYIVGLMKTTMRRPFHFPGPVPMLSLQDVLEPHQGSPREHHALTATKKQRIQDGINLLRKRYAESSCLDVTGDSIFNIGGTKVDVSTGVCPTITARRASECGYWSLEKERSLTVVDMLRLQGFNEAMFAGWEAVISPQQLGVMIGNAMTLTVMERIVAAIFM